MSYWHHLSGRWTYLDGEPCDSEAMDVAVAGAFSDHKLVQGGGNYCCACGERLCPTGEQGANENYALRLQEHHVAKLAGDEWRVKPLRD